MADDQSGWQGVRVAAPLRAPRCWQLTTVHRGRCCGALTARAADGTVPAAGFIPRWCRWRTYMKKLKNESELFKAALLAAMNYAEERGAVEFEATDSASQKLLYVYRLLVHDKLIQPIPEIQVSEAALRHKLAIWYARQLPEDHPLLK
jgi:hypothetical protein